MLDGEGELSRPRRAMISKQWQQAMSCDPSHNRNADGIAERREAKVLANAVKTIIWSPLERRVFAGRHPARPRLPFAGFNDGLFARSAPRGAKAAAKTIRSNLPHRVARAGA